MGLIIGYTAKSPLFQKFIAPIAIAYSDILNIASISKILIAPTSNIFGRHFATFAVVKFDRKVALLIDFELVFVSYS